MSYRQGPVGEDISKRLARIAGHAGSLKRFWDENRECDEMLTQISAVRAALDQAGRIILEQHIEHCILEAIERGEAADAIKDLKKSLNRLL